MTKLLYIVFSFLIAVNCSQKTSSTELEDNFTETEVKDLYKLVNFFQEQMCNSNSNFKRCMDSLTPILGEYGWQPILKNVDYQEQQKIYESFESNVFNEIWSICKSRNPREGWERKSLCLNPNGKYINFLEDLGKRNGVLEAYKNSLLAAGDFMDIQRIEYEIYNKLERIDLNDPDIQVLIAIDYLTQNDQQKRKEPLTEK